MFGWQGRMAHGCTRSRNKFLRASWPTAPTTFCQQAVRVALMQARLRNQNVLQRSEDRDKTFGSRGRIRTDNLEVNSFLLHH